MHLDCALTPVQPFTLGKMLLPVVAFELRIEMFFLGKPYAEIGDELPACRHIEGAADFLRLKDRNPADANALRPRREPKSMNRGNDRIIERLGHGLAAKTMACFGRMVAEDRKMDGRFPQSCEFEAGIKGSALAFVRFERRRVAGMKTVDHGIARRLRFDADKTPGLAVADRGRKGSGANKTFDKRGWQAIGLETPDIAPPGKKLL